MPVVNVISLAGEDQGKKTYAYYAGSLLCKTLKMKNMRIFFNLTIFWSKIQKNIYFFALRSIIQNKIILW